jgi:hypothetical protein
VHECQPLFWNHTRVQFNDESVRALHRGWQLLGHDPGLRHEHEYLRALHEERRLFWSYAYL